MLLEKLKSLEDISRQIPALKHPYSHVPLYECIRDPSAYRFQVLVHSRECITLATLRQHQYCHDNIEATASHSSVVMTTL